MSSRRSWTVTGKRLVIGRIAVIARGVPEEGGEDCRDRIARTRTALRDRRSAAYGGAPY